MAGRWELAGWLASALLLRWTVSLHGYSGECGEAWHQAVPDCRRVAALWRGFRLVRLLKARRWRPLPRLLAGMGVPPRYGDYEAQRHWMEITVNLPPGQW